MTGAESAAQVSVKRKHITKKKLTKNFYNKSLTSTLKVTVQIFILEISATNVRTGIGIL